jgi:hypothetical protein
MRVREPGADKRRVSERHHCMPMAWLLSRIAHRLRVAGSPRLLRAGHHKGPIGDNSPLLTATHLPLELLHECTEQDLTLLVSRPSEPRSSLIDYPGGSRRGSDRYHAPLGRVAEWTANRDPGVFWRPGCIGNPQIPAEKTDEIARLTQESKPEGETHWSCRSMAKRPR